MGFGGKFSKKPYLEQFERIERWHSVLNKFRFSNESEDKTDYQVDCIYTFFTNCFHLKDWLIHSKVTDSEKIHAEVINKYKEMMICRDICNGVKHLSVTDPSIGKNVDCDCDLHGVFLHREYNPWEKKNPVKDITYNIFVEYGKFNVFLVADKCVKIWKNYLKDNNLI